MAESAQIFDYYKYTGNRNLLKNRIYPVMSGAARFCLDWLEEGEDGKYRTPLSTSPENTFLDEAGRECAVSGIDYGFGTDKRALPKS